MMPAAAYNAVDYFALALIIVAGIASAVVMALPDDRSHDNVDLEDGDQ